MNASNITTPLDVFRLDGRVAIVTGASAGLGAHFARVLHAAGAKVSVAARRVERLESLVAELPGAIAIGADVSSPADRERLVAETAERLGPPRILVNNAGIGHTRSRWRTKTSRPSAKRWK
jgi:NAD(P)-dependent dehydrogenase (short-subunit alcohol dehydrogenase family)